jgi:AmiR/NasT family two-component response regulator
MAQDELSDPRLAAALARIAELDTEVQAARRSVADLTAALETNREIGAAIGVVMATREVELDEAFDLLRQASQARHIKLRAVAQEVVAQRRLAVAPASLDGGPRPVPGPPRPIQRPVQLPVQDVKHTA